jgi:hypothetical protein
MVVGEYVVNTAGPVRLPHLIEQGKLLWCYCTACGHEADLKPGELPLPADTPVPDVRWSMRRQKGRHAAGVLSISRCGSGGGEC